MRVEEPSALSIDTPALVLDRQKLRDNIQTMQAYAEQMGVAVRPHIKTHKCTHIARLQREHGAIGISAAKVSEAEALVKAGINGILITSPVVTEHKIARLMTLLQRAPDLMVVVDSPANACQLNDACRQANLSLTCLVDIDPGVHRTGVNYDQAPGLARTIHNHTHLNLTGLQCYAGNLQHIATFEARQAASTKAMTQAAAVRRQLLEAGLPCPILTGTGTGTFDIDSAIDGVTEIQPGSYTVMDQEYANIQGYDQQPFSRFHHAMTQLVTVISANHDTHVTVDAGLKALYIDPTHPRIISHPGLKYDWNGFGDEHGKVTAVSGVPLPGVGEVLELIVPHCDPTINLFDRFYVVEGGQVVDIWPIDLRGCSQ